MKAYLYSNKGVFQLGSKVTTIGSTGCDLILKHPTIDEQHAIIEFTNDGIGDGFYTILDYGSRHGTYINGNCVVPNMSILLDNHSSLQFGKDASMFEFVTELTEKVGQINIRNAWTQNENNYTIEDVRTHLPQVNVPAYATMKSYSNGFKPHNSTLRPFLPQANYCRPVSAEILQRRASPVYAKNRKQGGWLTGGNLMRSSSSSDLQYLAEKESKLEELEDDLKRLNHIEIDSQKKDIIIDRLKNQIDQLKQQVMAVNDKTIQEKLYYLEKEVLTKKDEITVLKNKINRMGEETPENNSSFRTTDIKENLNLKRNLDILLVEKEDLTLQMNILRTTIITKDQEIDGMKNRISELVSRIEDYERTKNNLDEEIANLKSLNESLDNKIKNLHCDKEIFVNDIFVLKNEKTKLSTTLLNIEEENEHFKTKLQTMSISNEELLNKLLKYEEDNIKLKTDINTLNDIEILLTNKCNDLMHENVVSKLTDIPDFLTCVHDEKENLHDEIKKKKVPTATLR